MKKSVYDELTVLQLLDLLRFSELLAFKKPLQEKLELYLLDRLETNNMGEPFTMNGNYVSLWLMTIYTRWRPSLIQIRNAIRFIDRYFDIAIQPESRQRQELKVCLAYLDNHIKAEFKDE